jgi:signal transduction histidine kinase
MSTPAAPSTRLHVLLVEDNAMDAELLIQELLRAGFAADWEQVDNEKDYLARLDDEFDLILSDYQLPQFDGLRALELLQERGQDVPFIIVSGAIGEDTAVRAMQRGAADYLLKDRLARLGPSVTHALEQARLRRERKRAEDRLKLANKRYRALAGRLETIREQERTAMAREIHDVLAQELTRLKIDLVWLAKHLGRPVDESLRPELVARITDATALTDTAITTVQRIATGLRPVILDSLGLPAAIEWQAGDFSQRTGLVCNVTVPGGNFTLDRDRATALFRILQESLTNIVRHAGASQVKVNLVELDHAIELTVQDDGSGISNAATADPRSIGLIGMSERAQAFGGVLTIAGTPGVGTTVTALIPRAGVS